MRRALSLGILIFVLLILAMLTALAEGPARFPTPASPPAGRDASACVHCHDGTSGAPESAMWGGAVHFPVEAMLHGRGALGVAGMPSPHLPPKGEPTCTPCHGEGEAEGAANKPDACLQPGCHEGMDAGALKDLADQRQEEIGNLLEELQAALDAVADKDSSTYQIALTNLTFVQADGSLGLHNYAYAKAALESSLFLIREAPEVIAPGQGPKGGHDASPLVSWAVTGMLAIVPGSVAFLWRRRWLQ